MTTQRTPQHWHVKKDGRTIATYMDFDKADDHVQSMRVGPEDPRYRQSDPWIGFYVESCRMDCLGPQGRSS